MLRLQFDSSVANLPLDMDVKSAHREDFPFCKPT